MKEPTGDGNPVPPEVEDQRPRCGDMESDDEGEVEGFPGGLAVDQVVPPEQGGDEDAVPEA